MERTKWDEMYSGCRRDLLLNISEMGSARYTVAFSIGQLKGMKLISPASDERKISRLVMAADQMFDRCEETMRHTGRPILCWLCIANETPCFPKPFAFLGRASSRQGYRRYWRRFIAFIFRAYRMDLALRDEPLGVSLKRRHHDALRSIWDHKMWDLHSLLLSPCRDPQANEGEASQDLEEEEEKEEYMEEDEEDDEEGDEEGDEEADEEEDDED
jgi:hypothetical protein